MLHPTCALRTIFGFRVLSRFRTPATAHMLTLENLRKSYGKTLAVDDLSLTVPNGCIFGFLGPNGAGKTTTMSMAVGLLRPDAGRVDLGGRGSPMDPEVRRSIGMAPQTIALYDDLSARENLQIFARLYGLTRTQARTSADRLLELVGLTDRAADRVRHYSGGMKRRLNLAAALLHDPPLVLLDEPTAGVDPQSRNAILEIVRSLRDQGRTIVYTTHYMEEAQRLCDHVAVIDRGRLLAIDTVDGLIQKHAGQSTVTVHRATGQERFQTTDPVAELTVRLREPDILNVRIDRPDLEAVFLTLTGRSLRD
jgi:ABC-2 type transport system ATP-binding protein